MMKEDLKTFGIDERRLRIEWISASEGDVYQQVATEFTEEIRSLGPLDWRKRIEQTEPQVQAMAV